MNWKEFFKPTKRKTGIFLLLFIISSITAGIVNAPFCADCGFWIGFPLTFLIPGGYSPIEHAYIPTIYSLPNFIIDVIFWFTISPFFVFLYKKFKK